MLQLAADASNAIAMTDDEKKRLEDLLCDLDRVPEAFPEHPDPSEVSPTCCYFVTYYYCLD